MGTWVEMIVGVSGGRGDGTLWPDVGGLIELGDVEAADLIRAQIAKPAKAPAKAKGERKVDEKRLETANLDAPAETHSAPPAETAAAPPAAETRGTVMPPQVAETRLPSAGTKPAGRPVRPAAKGPAKK